MCDRVFQVLRLSAASLGTREARGMAAGRGLGGQDKARVSPHCCTTNCVVPLRGDGGCWTSLEVIEVEMPFPVGKTLWKYTTKHRDGFGNVTVIRDLPIIFQSAESLLNLPRPEVTLQWKCICQKQIPSLRYQLYQQNNDEVSQEAFFQICSI